jgi:hypothetical protein
VRSHSLSCYVSVIALATTVGRIIVPSHNLKCRMLLVGSCLLVSSPEGHVSEETIQYWIIKIEPSVELWPTDWVCLDPLRLTIGRTPVSLGSSRTNENPSLRCASSASTSCLKQPQHSNRKVRIIERTSGILTNMFSTSRLRRGAQRVCQSSWRKYRIRFLKADESVM